MAIRIRPLFRLLAFTLLFAAFSSGCGGKATFVFEGLKGREITHLHQHQQRLYASTDAGLFSKTLGQSEWTALGLQHYRIEDIAIIDEQHLLAAVLEVATTNTGQADDDALAIQQPHLMETLDGGQTWQPVLHDFGGGFEDPIHALHFDSNSGVLYGSGVDVLAQSTDLGRSWHILSGAWGGFSQPKRALALNPHNGQVWFGGQNAMEQMVLRRFDPATGVTDEFPDLLPMPAVIYGITFDPNNANRILASGEGGFAQSLDNGVNWTQPLGDVDHRFYFDVVLDPQKSTTLYTAGWAKNGHLPQPLIVEVSRDSGQRWRQYRHPDNNLFGGARSLLAVTEQNRTVLYVGLYYGGIMKVLLPR